MRLTRNGTERVDPNLIQAIPLQVHLSSHDPERVDLDIRVPLSALSMEHANGTWRNTVVVTAYAYDMLGKVRDGEVQQLDTLLSDASYEHARSADQKVETHVRLKVSKAAKFLLVYMRDPRSQRVGSLLLRAEMLASLPVGAGNGPAAPLPVPGAREATR